MPEGPEIKFLNLFIKGKILHKKLFSITYKHSSIKINEKVIRVGSKGKLLWIETTNKFIYVRFGLTGWFSFDNKKFEKFIFKFGDFDMFLNDERKFSSIYVTKKKNISLHNLFKDKTGPDILTKSFTLEYFSSIIKKTSQLIPLALIDQTKFAGIGNYIRNEALYLAKIYPLTKSTNLSNSQIKKLYEKIKFVAYSNLIDMLKENKMSYKKFINEKFKAPYHMKVYRKKLDPAGKKITRITLGSRSLYYVKGVQLKN